LFFIGIKEQQTILRTTNDLVWIPAPLCPQGENRP